GRTLFQYGCGICAADGGVAGDVSPRQPDDCDYDAPAGVGCADRRLRAGAEGGTGGGIRAGEPHPMKTNGARFLESLGIAFELREYEVDPEDLSAIAVAKKIGMPPEQVFK